MSDSPAALLEDTARILRDKAVHQLDSMSAIHEARAKGKPLTPTEAAQFAKIVEEVRVAESDRVLFQGMRLDREARVRIRREPLTYAQETRDVSFFRDLMLAKSPGAGQENTRAVERLRHHDAEMRVVNADAERRTLREMARTGEDVNATFESRTAPNTQPGQGGNFAPPKWLVDASTAGLAPRPNRVLADLVRLLPLGQGYQSVNVPRLSTGTLANTATDGAAVPGADWTDMACYSQVQLIAGQSDVSLQMVEQAPGNAVDLIIWADLLNSADAQVENSILNGVGGASIGAPVPGILATGSPNGITYTSGSPTLSAMYGYIGQTTASISNTRKMRPEVWLMRNGRWAWVATSLDSQSRPIVTPDLAPPVPRNDGAPVPIGSLLGLPVFTDEQISTTSGTAANQDAIVAARPSDYILWQTPNPIIMALLEPLSGTMGVRVQLRSYIAFIGNRYAGTSTAVLSGTGMAVQAGF